MACGTIGPGRLSEPEKIVAAALDILRAAETADSADLKDERLLITVGATREPIDPVRFISNRSSGRMGFAIAEAARRRGAQVAVIAGATTAAPPIDLNIIRTSSAAEMDAAVAKEVPNATVFIAAAAVADYRPAIQLPNKLKKAQASLNVELVRTPDILKNVADAKKDGLLIVGFAAETEDVLANAREKLRAKNLDAIVANDVTRTDAGFDTVNNEVTIISRDGRAPIHVPLMNKTRVANIILDEIVRLRARANAIDSNKSAVGGPRKI
jgi:phosphopantothenoylcysteine decarboxylase/phosphopantothenate--cysteine ligase